MVNGERLKLIVGVVFLIGLLLVPAAGGGVSLWFYFQDEKGSEATVELTEYEVTGGNEYEGGGTGDVDSGQKPPDGTQPEMTGAIEFDHLGIFKFDPGSVATVRPDIFKPGYFSLFDILVHLDDRGEIELEYHFDEELNTHLIDSIDNMGGWWYWAYYDGGWQERNGFRMDHYPYKEKTTVRVIRENEDTIEEITGHWREEVERLEANDGKVILPRVTIFSDTFDLEFSDVEVTAHDLRSDTFVNGTITAIDVIMSLGDQGKLSYELKWYESIADADPVKSYWVHRINEDEAYGTCGYVYEEGDESSRRNHIHIPSDQRVLNSPEYEEWFWICL